MNDIFLLQLILHFLHHQNISGALKTSSKANQKRSSPHFQILQGDNKEGNNSNNPFPISRKEILNSSKSIFTSSWDLVGGALFPCTPIRRRRRRRRRRAAAAAAGGQWERRPAAGGDQWEGGWGMIPSWFARRRRKRRGGRRLNSSQSPPRPR